MCLRTMCGALFTAAACVDDPAAPSTRAILLRLPHDSLFWGRSVAALAIALGDSAGDANPRFIWTTSDTNVAVVDSIGVVTGIGLGAATIGAELDGHRAEYVIRVVVQRADGGVAFMKGSPAYGQGQCAIAVDGTVYCRRALPTADTMPLFQPMPEPTGLQFSEVHTAQGSQCALATTGLIYCWGTNEHWSFGSRVPSTSSGAMPVEVKTGALRFSTMTYGGHAQICAVSRADSMIYCWGHNDQSQGGRLPLVASDSVPAPVTGNFRALSVSTANFSTCFLDLQGAAYCSGGFGATQSTLGVSEVQIAAREPLPVVGVRSFATISAGEGFQCALTAGNDAYCWGANNKGRLGIGTLFPPPSIGPQPVLGGHKFATVSVSYPEAACGITTDGDLYCWGEFRPVALARQRGLAATKPVHVLPGYTFRDITRHLDQICGIVVDGSILCW